MLSYLLRCCLALVIVALLGVGGCHQDITQDPYYNFSTIAGRCFVARQDLFFSPGAANADFELQMSGDCQSPKSGAEYDSSPSWKYPSIAGVLRKGERIRVERLIREPLNDTIELHPVGRVLDGRFAGKSVAIGLLLGSEKGGRWVALPDFLTPCDASKK
jgi:hypothetical protein